MKDYSDKILQAIERILTHKRLESIEINLLTFSVMQSRGLQNQPTEHHKDIVELINKNMNQIKRIRKAI